VSTKDLALPPAMSIDGIFEHKNDINSQQVGVSDSNGVIQYRTSQRQKLSREPYLKVPNRPKILKT
jgi:hypothetical protein